MSTPRRPYKRRSADRYRGLCECGEHAWAVLTKGYVTFVSPEDAYLLGEANWHAASKTNSDLVYATKHKEGEHEKLIRLHCVIVGGAQEVDHAATPAISTARLRRAVTTQEATLPRNTSPCQAAARSACFFECGG
jgi:hypothetical protein